MKKRGGPRITEDSPFFQPRRMGNKRGPMLAPASELAGRALRAKDSPSWKGRVVSVRDSKGEKSTTYYGSANFMHHPRLPRGARRGRS
jgi:hypothetical protein